MFGLQCCYMSLLLSLVLASTSPMHGGVTSRGLCAKALNSESAVGDDRRLRSPRMFPCFVLPEFAFRDTTHATASQLDTCGFMKEDSSSDRVEPCCHCDVFCMRPLWSRGVAFARRRCRSRACCDVVACTTRVTTSSLPQLQDTCLRATGGTRAAGRAGAQAAGWFPVFSRGGGGSVARSRGAGPLS